MSGTTGLKPYAQYVQDLGARESGGDYKAKNQFGFLGKYQFGLARLSDLGLCTRVAGTTGAANRNFTWVPPYSEAAFLGTPALQDQCFDVHVGRYANWMALKYTQAMGRVFCGVTVTVSGAIAVCHLVGLGGFMDLIKGHDAQDANGTHASEYAGKFGGYAIPVGLPLKLKRSTAVA